MSANGFLMDAEIRHQILIQRLAGKTFNDVDEVLQSLRQSIMDRLGREPTDFQLHRLRLLLSDIEGIMNEHGGRVDATLREELEDFLEYETGFQQRTLGQVLNVDAVLPSIEQVSAAFTSEPTEIVSGNSTVTRTIGDLIAQFNEGRKQEISNLIRGGFIEGRTTDQVARDVQRRVEGRTRAQARALVRTSQNHAATVARRETMKANSDVLEGEEWVAVLDLRTSMTCMGLSGQVFDVGRGPYPPQHFNAIAGGEKVRTARGLVPIEQVKVGDLAVTHRGRYKPVSATMSKRNDSGVIRVIRLESGRVVRATDEHPFLVDGRGWVRADELKTGDNVFENVSEREPFAPWLAVVEGAPNHYPSLFDGDEVFTGVNVAPGSVAPAVDFNNYFMVNKREVSNASTENHLVRNVIKMLSEKVHEAGFAFRRIFAVPFNGALHRVNEMLNALRRVVLGHPLRMPGVNFAGFFGEAVSPMIFSDPDAFGYVSLSDNAHYFASGNRCNSVAAAPVRHSAIGKGKLPLDLPKTLEAVSVVFFDESAKFVPVAEVNHWQCSTVSDISIVEHSGAVYNLEVEGDNSYLVDDVVVHNCRSVRVPKVKEEFSLFRSGSTRPATGAEGVEQVSTRKTFGGWLGDQPASFQREFFGKFEQGEERYRLFSQGRLDPQKFIDPDGVALSLDELREMEPLAFERAGL